MRVMVAVHSWAIGLTLEPFQARNKYQARAVNVPTKYQATTVNVPIGIRNAVASAPASRSSTRRGGGRYWAM
eukprot:4345830-Pyramimonas_sp.AAC.1